MSRPVTPLSPEWESAWLEYSTTKSNEGQSPRTLLARRATVNKLARWLGANGGVTDPEHVTKAHIQAFKAANPCEGTGGGALHNNLRSFFQWLAHERDPRLEQCPEPAQCRDPRHYGPMSGIRRPKVDDPVTPVFTSEEIAAILGACAGREPEKIRNRAIVLLLLESGLRHAELCALTVADVSVEHRDLIVRRGKGGKSREATFGDDTAAALSRWLRVRAKTPGAAGRSALFLALTGNPLSYTGLSSVLREVGTDAGVDDVRAHKFRHAWAHYNLASGIQEHELMTLAGWTSTRQLGRYGAALEVQRAKAAGRRHQVAAIVKNGAGVR